MLTANPATVLFYMWEYLRKGTLWCHNWNQDTSIWSVST